MIDVPPDSKLTIIRDRLPETIRYEEATSKLSERGGVYYGNCFAFAWVALQRIIEMNPEDAVLVVKKGTPFLHFYAGLFLGTTLHTLHHTAADTVRERSWSLTKEVSEEIALEQGTWLLCTLPGTFAIVPTQHNEPYDQAQDPNAIIVSKIADTRFLKTIQATYKHRETDQWDVAVKAMTEAPSAVK